MAIKIHVLKTWPEYFEAVRDGSKAFEYRHDVGFKTGDYVVLIEWSRIGDPIVFLPRILIRRISYILRNAETIGLPEDYCVLQLEAK